MSAKLQVTIQLQRIVALTVPFEGMLDDYKLKLFKMRLGYNKNQLTLQRVRPCRKDYTFCARICELQIQKVLNKGFDLAAVTTKRVHCLDVLKQGRIYKYVGRLQCMQKWRQPILLYCMSLRILGVGSWYFNVAGASCF